MFTPEVFLFGGLFMVIGSLIALWIAGAIRDWFFTPDTSAEFRPVPAPKQVGKRR